MYSNSNAWARLTPEVLLILIFSSIKINVVCAEEQNFSHELISEWLFVKVQLSTVLVDKY